jgi:hypothetical protein
MSHWYLPTTKKASHWKHKRAFCDETYLRDISCLVHKARGKARLDISEAGQGSELQSENKHEIGGIRRKITEISQILPVMGIATWPAGKGRNVQSALWGRITARAKAMRTNFIPAYQPRKSRRAAFISTFWRPVKPPRGLLHPVSMVPLASLSSELEVRFCNVPGTGRLGQKPGITGAFYLVPRTGGVSTAVPV